MFWLLVWGALMLVRINGSVGGNTLTPSVPAVLCFAVGGDKHNLNGIKGGGILENKS